MAKGKNKPNRKEPPRKASGKQVITRTIRINQVLGSATASSTRIDPVETKELAQVFSYFNNVKFLRATLKYHSLCGTDTQGAIYLALTTEEDAIEWAHLDADSKLAWIASGGTVTAARSGASVSKVFKDVDWVYPELVVGQSMSAWIANGSRIHGFIGTTSTTPDLLLGHLELVLTMEVTGQQQVTTAFAGKILGSENIQYKPDAVAPLVSGVPEQKT
jgi:hypothetical protein